MSYPDQKSPNIYELLVLMLIYLKLTGQIDWQWLTILAPVWIIWGLALIGVCFKETAKLMQGTGAKSSDLGSDEEKNSNENHF